MNSNECEEENLQVATVPDNEDQDNNCDVISSFEKKKSNQKLYIKTKDSIIHLGTKVVFEVQNEKDIKKFKPILESLKRETLQKEKPKGLKNEIEMADKNGESIDDNENVDCEEFNSEAEEQNPEHDTDRISSDEIKLDKLLVDLSISKENNECLLTPEYFKASPCIYSSASLQSSSNQMYKNVTAPVASSTPFTFSGSSIGSSTNMSLPSGVHTPTTKAVMDRNILTHGNKHQLFNPAIVKSNSQLPYFNLNPNGINNSFVQGQSPVLYPVQDSADLKYYYSLYAENSKQFQPVSTSGNFATSHAGIPYVNTCIASDSRERFSPVSSGIPPNNHARFPPITSAIPLNNHAVFPPVTSAIPLNNHAIFPPVTSAIPPNNHAGFSPITSAIPPNNHVGFLPVTSAIPPNNHAGFPAASSCIPASTSTTDNFSSLPKKKVHSSLSLPVGLCNQPTQINNYTDEDRISALPRERLLRERPKNDWIPLGVNFIEERNFKLGIIPGKFFDTQNGVVVEMQNGKHYTIFLINDNEEQCDVDVFVDTHIVAKLRLEGKSSEYLDGPRFSSLKFTFVRARDAPPQAEIMFNDEGNGLIEVIFKPEKKHVAQKRLRERAWSAESSGPFLRTLNETLGNLLGPKEEENSDLNTDARYRSGSYCAGATALQGKQKDRYAELVNDIEIDENRIVVLQLRLVARTDDSSELERDEPIRPLITKRPPPLPL